MHKGEHISDGSWTEGCFTGDRTFTTIGQGCPHHCQCFAVHLKRTSLESIKTRFSESLTLRYFKSSFKSELLKQITSSFCYFCTSSKGQSKIESNCLLKNTKHFIRIAFVFKVHQEKSLKVD